MPEDLLTPTVFTRHKRQLRAVLLEDQCWFCAHDLGRLTGFAQLAERVTRNLDDDQHRQAWVRDGNGDYVDELLLSESAVYATLVHFFHPENRCIRQWLTQHVIPTLRDQHRTAPDQPRRETLHGPTQSLTLLRWQGVLWVPYRQWPELSASAER
ncbi:MULTISPECIES: BRO-N domain-containing protein [unclassified Pseudomonas]|uniref:BRO-N domain-containing protein n=1 Tax=unclassified Pseudomonas TaxID=196821 RepID=UPI00244AA667|nr:Bro-N domain-containing protein [Pseudomonas sp. GD03944]MDH1261837.1 Bro-N domain-containing protein [Pseudomonas sp. GD03944]